MQYGFKTRSNEESLRKVLKDSSIWNDYDFLELYVVPGTYEQTKDFWKGLEVPFFVIHAPHFSHGCNFSLEENFQKNLEFFEESKKFCEQLDAKHIIIHLGTKGSLEESIRQINSLNFNGILIENKPQIALDGSLCVGSSPEEIQIVLRECRVGFCLDVSHAIAYSAYHQLHCLDILKKFIRLSPKHYHLCDGLITNTKDKHMNIGEGNYDLKAVFHLLPKEATITLETPKKPEEGTQSFILEVQRLRQCEPLNSIKN